MDLHTNRTIKAFDDYFRLDFFGLVNSKCKFIPLFFFFKYYIYHYLCFFIHFMFIFLFGKEFNFFFFHFWVTKNCFQIKKKNFFLQFVNRFIWFEKDNVFQELSKREILSRFQANEIFLDVILPLEFSFYQLNSLLFYP